MAKKTISKSDVRDKAQEIQGALENAHGEIENVLATLEDILEMTSEEEE